MANATVRGWINYYGRFCPCELRSPLSRINEYLISLGRTETQAFVRPYSAGSRLLAGPRTTRAESLCSLAVRSAAVRLGNGSRVSREPHARFCEGQGVKLPPTTHRLARRGITPDQSAYSRPGHRADRHRYRPRRSHRPHPDR